MESAHAPALIGRERELDLVDSFLARAALDAEALLLVGEPGVGKSALLEAAAARAAAGGTRVLRAVGAEFESDLAFSGLNQVFFPLFGELEQLGGGHRRALSAALGIAAAEPADRLTVSTAAVALLRRAAGPGPLLVVVDDLHWLDQPSAAVLGFALRRLTGSAIGLLAAVRDGQDGHAIRDGWPAHELPPLDEAASTGLLGARFPALAADVRRRVLAEAHGNPLALLELPAALSIPQRTARQKLPPVLPHSPRLSALFAPRIDALPAPTRRALLTAALDGTGDLGTLQAAAGGEDVLDLLEPAEQARLVSVDHGGRRLVFRHPLVRSAVVALATVPQRRRVQQALADVLAGQPERRVRHLADATIGPDEAVAKQLEEVAHLSIKRGDSGGAVTALRRAAEFSPRGADRGRRLAEAAYVEADVAGGVRAAPRLLADARAADPDSTGSLEAATAATYLILNDGGVDTAHGLLVRAIEARAGRYDAEDHVLVEALYTLFTVCWFGGARPELWEPFHAALGRLGPRPPAVLAICASTFVDPARTSAETLEELDCVLGRMHTESDCARIVWIGRAAFFVDRLAACREAHWRVLRDGRGGGAVASAIGALIHLGFDSLFSGRWDEAADLAAEGVELCRARGYELLQWPLWLCQAILAAGRGEHGLVQSLTDDMARWGTPRRVGTVTGYTHYVRAFAALGRGDAEEAYRNAVAVSPPGVLAANVPFALWSALDLVESAVLTGRRAEAGAHAAALREAAVARLSPRFALVAAVAQAMTAPAGSAAALFQDAVNIPGVECWPFELARARLAYGELLRRTHATVEARVQLAIALDAFRCLGARPWAARAGHELRAAGHGGPAGRDRDRAQLTPQEYEIALLAATGLSNKQIGQRLHLSHRTVGAHLYRIFPKLGIGSRAALRDALAPQSGPR